MITRSHDDADGGGGEKRHHLVDVCTSGLRAPVQRIVVRDGKTDHVTGHGCSGTLRVIHVSGSLPVTTSLSGEQIPRCHSDSGYLIL